MCDHEFVFIPPLQELDALLHSVTLAHSKCAMHISGALHNHNKSLLNASQAASVAGTAASVDAAAVALCCSPHRSESCFMTSP